MSVAEVDFAYEDHEDPFDVLATIQEKYATLKATVVDVRGPGGGWPVVRLTGTRDEVETALRVYWNMDDEDINDTIQQVKGA